MVTIITTTINTTTVTAIAETVDIIVVSELFPEPPEPEAIGTASKGHQGKHISRPVPQRIANQLHT